jgi:hypothetical protein
MIITSVQQIPQYRVRHHADVSLAQARISILRGRALDIVVQTETGEWRVTFVASDIAHLRIALRSLP